MPFNQDYIVVEAPRVGHFKSDITIGSENLAMAQFPIHVAMKWKRVAEKEYLKIRTNRYEVKFSYTVV